LNNAFQYFAVAGFINALVLSLLLLLNKRNHLAKFYMIGLVLIVTFQAILNAFDNRDFFLAWPHLSKISWLIPSLFGPLIYLFTIKLCTERPASSPKDLLHFLPFAFYLVLLLPWYLQPASIKIAYLGNFELARQDDFGFLNQLSILIILIYLLATLRFLNRFRKRIEQTYSEISQKRVEWMSTFAFAVLAILMFSAIGFYGRKWQIPFLHALYHFNYVLLVLLVYWIGYKALLQPVIFESHNITTLPSNNQHLDIQADPDKENEEPVESEIRKYTRSGLEDEQAEKIYDELIHFMKTKKPFLNPELNIYQLSDDLNLKKHHLSQVINEKSGMNFFDFINTFRVEEIKRNLANPSLKNLTLLGIGLESGFNSKATFNSAFKKFTGLTPSDYQKNLKKGV
jgi:AraC-like DNA-binding protein